MNRMDAMRLYEEDIIRRAGWMVQGVFPTHVAPGPTFCYSIGMHDKGLPEVIVFGLPVEVGTMLINDVGQFLLERKSKGQPFTGKFEHPRWPMPFVVAEAPVSEATQYATGAERRSNGQATYLQIFWPDRNGKYPWDDGVVPKHFQGQPILAKSLPH